MKAAVERWTRDFAHAARSLARAPGFTLIVVATLALPVGANTAIFSLVKVVLLERLPYPNADRLVHIGGTAPGTDQPEEFGVPDELYFEYRESAPGIEDIAIYGIGSSTTRAEGRVDQLFVSQATPSFFTTLGAQPLHGRLPTDQGRRHGRRDQPLAVAGLVQLRSDRDRPQLQLCRPEPFGDRHHEAGLPLPR